MERNSVFGFVLSFFNSAQNQLPQIVIGQGLVVYHVEALLVVIRTTFINFEKFKISQCRKKTGLKFLFKFRAN